jgi:hypothetical protein
VLGELIAELETAQKELELNVFAHPPADWAAFQERLGQWRGIDTALEVIKSKDKELQEDEQRQ